jgi:hypothetical protein
MVYAPVNSGLSIVSIVDPTRYTKMWQRSDIQGWPLTDSIDVLPTAGAPTWRAQNLLGQARSLLVSEVRLDRLSLDTARDAAVWPCLTATQPLWTRTTLTVERRRPNTTWFETTGYVNAVSGIIDFATGVGRAQLDYFTRLVTS